ncbi:hypothetical protein [Halochromatium sp.]
MAVALQMAVAEQAIRTFDPVAQLATTAETSANLAQRQPGSTHRPSHCLEQHVQAPSVYRAKQRANTAV